MAYKNRQVDVPATLGIDQELFHVICTNGGVMELRSAIAKLQKPSREYVKLFGGAQRFVSSCSRFKVAQDGSKVNVEIILPLKFCPKIKEKQGCRAADRCAMLHLCPYFIKGTCSFKEKCRLSHQIRDQHNLSILRKFDLDFLDDRTLWQLMQKVVADTESQRAADNNPIPDVCKFYNNKGGCTNGEKCPFLHVCLHFVDGQCKFGNKCRRMHHFADQHNINVLKNHGLDHFGEAMVLHILGGRERKRTTSSSSDQSADGSVPNLPSPRRPSTPTSPLPKVTSPSFPVTPVSAPLIKEDSGIDICGFHLRGLCSYGQRCIRHHTDLPYLWQWKSPSSGLWESLSCDLNIMVEQAFCDANKKMFSLIMNGECYSINFDKMVATAESPKPNVAIKLPLRRLSTQSSVEAHIGHVFSTRWCWYWLDDTKTWQSYDSPGQGVPNTTCSQSLEKDFLAGEKSHPFSAGPHKYTLDYKTMKQQNDLIKTKRAVRRRPEFVGKNDMKEIAKRRAASRASAAAANGSEADKIPSHWDDIPADKEYIRVPLPTISQEYKEVEKTFQTGLASEGKRIVKIERIQNLDLWKQFAHKKERMDKKAKKPVEERKLFHGTSDDILPAICQQGFDWRMCGKHGTAYGKGSYFASTSSYSHCYTNSRSSGAGSSLFSFLTGRGTENHMFLARVLVGAYTTGSSSLVRPPPKDSSKPHGDLYDSCVDNMSNPGIFVVFENAQTYPEFLITYM